MLNRFFTGLDKAIRNSSQLTIVGLDSLDYPNCKDKVNVFGSMEIRDQDQIPFISKLISDSFKPIIDFKYDSQEFYLSKGYLGRAKPVFQGDKLEVRVLDLEDAIHFLACEFWWSLLPRKEEAISILERLDELIDRESLRKFKFIPSEMLKGRETLEIAYRECFDKLGLDKPFQNVKGN